MARRSEGDGRGHPRDARVAAEGRASGRRRLLFLTPVMPAEGGNGLAMRAGLFLDAFAADHEVTVLVVPVLGPVSPDVPAFVARRSARVVVVPMAGRVDPEYERALRLPSPGRRLAALRGYPAPALCRFASPDAVRAVAVAVGAGFHALHVMRLYLAPFAEPQLDGSPADRPWASLDLDDDEPATHRRLAALRAVHGDGARAALEAVEAVKYEALERRWLPRFDRVLVCSEGDGIAVRARTGRPAVDVVPNAVRIPARLDARPAVSSAFRLLFVGSLGYFPNEDAALLLCREILPRVRAGAGRPVEVQLAGSSPPARIARLGAMPGVAVAANPPDVTPFYQKADVVVVPMRAGGGTRLKLLEAFAHRVPAVATSIAAEGLAVKAGRHLVIADDPDGLADGCLALLRDPERARALTAQAADLVASRYAHARVVATIRKLAGAPVGVRPRRPLDAILDTSARTGQQ